MSRPTWDETFESVARIWAARSTCSRRKVGAVLVKSNKVIGQGYNGVISGATHCDEGGCPRGQLTYTELPPDSDYNGAAPCSAIHAEANAILQAGMAAAEGASLYVTDQPCPQCMNLIKHAKVEVVIICD